MANSLINEKSPYLLQHAHNPVDWLPWGSQALARAKSENKPLFLSIGYSTCHWCHVMAHESFEDPEVARLINSLTVPVKIDREERPDLDGVYMAACQLMTGAGGWPLSIFADHQGRPFYAATYIPKNAGFGRAGLMELLPAIHQAWTDRRGEVEASSAKVHEALRESQTPGPAAGEPDATDLAAAFAHLSQRFDPTWGGFGAAPKFPSPHGLMFLLRHYKRSGDHRALHMVDKTLTAMRLGGIFDHVGLGFHRYSTDGQWLVPHFEKMLYDQAMLAMAYTEAWQVTQRPLFAQTAKEIFAFALRDLRDDGGAFLSAVDADSEGQEGKFYLWTEEQVRRVLAPDQAQVYLKLYNFAATGNFRDEAAGRAVGTNIPRLTDQPGDQAAWLEQARARLFAAREERVRPNVDDKILTDWNGLMIAALAKASLAFAHPPLAKGAAQAADFILARLRDSSGRLAHAYRDGQAQVPGTLDDYAFFIWGLVELYQASFDPVWLQAALDLCAQLLENFWDDQAGAFFLTAQDAETVLVRQKDFLDAALPSGNSVAMLVLLKLGRMAGRPDLTERAARLARCPAHLVKTHPTAFTMLLCAVDLALGPGADLVLAAPDPDSLEPFLEPLRRAFLPGLLLLRPDPEGRLAELASFTTAMTPLDNRATAYVCLDGRCQPPVGQVSEMLKLLGLGS